MIDHRTEVVILLAVFNGAQHLGAQLNSYLTQTHSAWRLIASDDGSVDATIEIFREFAEKHPAHGLKIVSGPQCGFAQNFLHLLRVAGPDANIVALSDQDDIWLPDKLSRGVSALAAEPENVPALYCARTQIVAPDLTPITLSRHWRRPFGFANSLVQNVAAGNTILLNRAALDIVQSAFPADIAAHDWWLYQVIAGAGGKVIWDEKPVLLYRQHAANEMGRNDTPLAMIARLRQIASGGFREWNGRNYRSLFASRTLLTDENKAILQEFANMRGAGLMARLSGLLRSRVYRQTLAGTLALWIAAFFRRL
jgi:glycosyltransferase involved in cell wall biosynthesis